MGKTTEELLYSSYFFKDKSNYNNEPKTYEELYHHITIINQYYNDTYSKKYHSPMADLIIKRMPENMTSDNLIDADLLCHYVSVLQKNHWFPITYVYRSRVQGHFDLLDRLVSKRHFEKVKKLFNVSSINELKEKLSEIQKNDNNNDRMRYSGTFDSVTPIYQVINTEKLGTTR